MSTDPAHDPHFIELLHECLRRTVDGGGSDLHVRPNEPPYMRARGHLTPIEGMETLTPEQVDGLTRALTRFNPKRMTEFEENGEADLSYSLEGVARFRVNIFRERGNAALTLRAIPTDVPQLSDLNLPPIIEQLASESHGLILVTGATGSGKTTTLAAMIDHINRASPKHILTIEDPIEIVHPNHQSIISQREVGTDTGDFQQALRRALRQDPDVILIGEIRDQETMQTAMAAAETGHLVLATLHTINAAETISRILDLFPPEYDRQARAMLAGALKGIISQRLARTTDGGRRAVVEVLVNTGRISDCIANPEDTPKLPEAIEQGAYYGMQSFDQALIQMVIDGTISEEEAIHHVSAPQNFKLVLAGTRSQIEADERKQAEEEERRLEAIRLEEEKRAKYTPILGAPVPGVPVPGAADPGVPQQFVQPGLTPEFVPPVPPQGMPTAPPTAAPVIPAAVVPPSEMPAGMPPPQAMPPGSPQMPAMPQQGYHPNDAVLVPTLPQQQAQPQPAATLPPNLQLPATPPPAYPGAEMHDPALHGAPSVHVASVDAQWPPQQIEFPQ